jgi:rod shape-determining protein MreC
MEIMRRESRRLLTFGVLILLTLGLLVMGSRLSIVRPVISAITAPLAPVARLLTGGTEAAASLTAPEDDPAVLKARNRELEKTVAEMQVEIVRLREIERDYYRLSGLVNYTTQHPDENVVTANVVSRDTSSYLRWIIINRGARDGVKEGNPVISDLGLVGRVEKVAANLAWVRLANDPASLINARTQENRAEGIVSGLLQGGMRMDKIPQTQVMDVGDLVLTSGLGGIFPADIVIGQVSSVRKPPAELFQTAEIRPTVDYNNLDIVTVITAFTPVDTSVFDDQTKATPGP